MRRLLTSTILATVLVGGWAAPSEADTVIVPIPVQAAQFLGSSFPSLTKTNGTNFPVMALAYDASADEAAFWLFKANRYGSGNLTLTIYLYADTASSGDVIFGAQISAITPNTDTQDIETDGLATAQTATVTHLGTTGQRLHEMSITISNLDSIAAGDIIHLRIYRDADAGGDTMTGDALVVYAEISYSDS
jgi:hypothetical protein